MIYRSLQRIVRLPIFVLLSTCLISVFFLRTLFFNESEEIACEVGLYIQHPSASTTQVHCSIPTINLTCPDNSYSRIGEVASCMTGDKRRYEIIDNTELNASYCNSKMGTGSTPRGYKECECMLNFEPFQGQCKYVAAEHGIAAYDRKDYKSALKLLTANPDMNDAVANFMLAEMYEDGLGVARNKSEAIRFFELATAQGHEGAKFRAASLYGYTKDTPNDLNKARSYFKDLIDVPGKLQPFAMRQLGLLEFIIPDGNHSEGFQWLLRAATKGDGDGNSAFTVGQLYEKGDGTTADPAKALHWYSEAAKLGQQEAKSAIDRLFPIYDEKFSNEPEVHSYIVQQAAEAGNPDAIRKLEQLKKLEVQQ